MRGRQGGIRVQARNPPGEVVRQETLNAGTYNRAISTGLGLIGTNCPMCGSEGV